ncbi:MAG TPA: hypothetical protein VM782_23750 [Stellaceae bacterium]|nr:hypothetical protein [Stellaceae bacterium]
MFLQILDLRLMLLLKVSDLGLVLLLNCCDFGFMLLLDCSDRVLQLSELVTHIRCSLRDSRRRQGSACNSEYSCDRPKLGKISLRLHLPPSA